MNTLIIPEKLDELEAIPAAPKAPEVYYDTGGKDYWILNDRSDWITVNETSLKRLLRNGGFSTKIARGESLSPVDKCLLEVNRKFDIPYAGPLAGYSKGPVDMCGQRILVTSSPKLIEPQQGDSAVLTSLIAKMLGAEQLPYYRGWLKTGFEALRSGQIRPGQVLVLAGERNTFKSVLQNLMTQVFGGRSAKPYRYMSGVTPFNGELFGAEHLMIEDDIASTDIRARRNFGTKIKEFTVNETQSCHAKNRQALTLKPFWRVSVSVNVEPENMLILPPFDDSVADKILLFRVNKQEHPMPTHTQAGRTAFWQTLMEQLPAYLWDLVNTEIPKEFQGDRFGVAHFHHPELLRALEETAPEMKLLAFIDDAFEISQFKADEGFLGTSDKLEAAILIGREFEARKLFSWPGAVGTYLGRLAKKFPNRVKEQRTATQRLWLISPP